MGKVATECISWRWHGNLGDDMIFAAQEEMFRDQLELGQYVADPRAVLVGGGTFVPKALEHPDLVRLSSELPTAFFGTGIEDPLFWGREHLPDWLKVLNNSAFIGVRGPLSQERLVEWGLPGERVEWIGDPALFFAGSGGSSRTIRGELAVNLGTTYGKLYGFDEPGLERVLQEALQELVRSGWNITLVCAWQPDEGVLDRLQQGVSVKAVEHWHDDYIRALDCVEKFDMVIAEKLHVGVVAACRNVPFIALNYRSKVLDYCRSIGWENFCVDLHDLKPGVIIDMVNRLTRGREESLKTLHENVSAIRARLLQAVPRVVSALARPSAETNRQA